MNQQNEAQQAQMDQQPERSAQKALSRRKFLLQASAVSVPAVLSLQSGKAWGCVELNCTPGETSLSNSGSAVASATSEDKKNAYERPQWSSLDEIQKAFYDDYDYWLLDTFNTALCTYEVKGSGRNKKYKYTALKFSKTKYNVWYKTVVLQEFGPVCVNRPTNDFVREAPVAPSVRIPGFYENALEGVSIVLDKTSDVSKIVPEFSGKVGSIIYGPETPQQYALAAIIGSLWERHPEYRKRFSANPICFPEPDVLIKAVSKACNEVDHNGRSKIHDIGSLFKLYMSPL